MQIIISFFFFLKMWSNSKITCSKETESGMSCHDPETIMFTTESIETSSFGQIPYSDALIFRIWEDELLFRMEKNARNVVVVTSASIHFPSLNKRTELYVSC